MRNAAKNALGSKRKKKIKRGKTKVKIKVKGSPNGVTTAIKKLAGNLGTPNQM